MQALLQVVVSSFKYEGYLSQQNVPCILLFPLKVFFFRILCSPFPPKCQKHSFCFRVTFPVVFSFCYMMSSQYVYEHVPCPLKLLEEVHLFIYNELSLRPCSDLCHFTVVICILGPVQTWCPCPGSLNIAIYWCPSTPTSSRGSTRASCPARALI